MDDSWKVKHKEVPKSGLLLSNRFESLKNIKSDKKQTKNIKADEKTNTKHQNGWGKKPKKIKVEYPTATIPTIPTTPTTPTAPTTTIPLLPEVEQFYKANPSLKGTCTMLEQELEAALSDVKQRLVKSEEKLTKQVEWWEESNKSNVEAELKLLEVDFLNKSHHTLPILPPAEWVEELDSSREDDIISSEECFSTIRLDWCSQHNITRQLCFVMQGKCSDDNQNEAEIKDEEISMGTLISPQFEPSMAPLKTVLTSPLIQADQHEPGVCVDCKTEKVHECLENVTCTILREGLMRMRSEEHTSELQSQ